MTERSLWLRKREPRNPYLLDGFIGAGIGAIVLVAFILTERTAEFPRDADALGITLAVLSWGPLVFRRRAPLVVFAVSVVAATVAYSLGYPDTGLGFAPLIALYTVASRCQRAVTVAALAAGIVTNVVSVLLVDVDGPLAMILAGSAGACGAAAWGDRKQVRQAYIEQLELRAAEKERERIEAAQRAVGAERARIARELHDVVAHAMSVVAVQSGVGAHVIDAQPEAAKHILETISDTSRAALAEMRRLLGVLRATPDGDGPGDDLAPVPGLAALGDLAARVTEAGVPVEVRVEGEGMDLPPGVDLAAYRIVQEALTNVLKHAGPARATVTVSYTHDAVHLVVTDDGRGAAANGDGAQAADGPLSPAYGPSGPGQLDRRDQPDRPGHGIVGMRERAELYGGSLIVGPRPGGGFRVAATLCPDAPVGAP